MSVRSGTLDLLGNLKKKKEFLVYLFYLGSPILATSFHFHKGHQLFFQEEAFAFLVMSFQDVSVKIHK